MHDMISAHKSDHNFNLDISQSPHHISVVGTHITMDETSALLTRPEFNNS
jgi:hypothetical protein